MAEPGGEMDVTGVAVGLSAAGSKGSSNLRLVSDGVPTGAALRRAMLIATGGWMFGSVWSSSMSGTPLTLYAKQLGATPFQFGLLAALPFLASILSLPASMLIEATGQRKRIFMLGLYLQRFLWFVIAIVPLWILNKGGFQHAQLAMSVFLWLMLIMYPATPSADRPGSRGWPIWCPIESAENTFRGDGSLECSRPSRPRGLSDGYSIPSPALIHSPSCAGARAFLSSPRFSVCWTFTCSSMSRIFPSGRRRGCS
jgi:hypothetical protein